MDTGSCGRLKTGLPPGNAGTENLKKGLALRKEKW
jgi:hypothetical protein